MSTRRAGTRRQLDSSIDGSTSCSRARRSQAAHLLTFLTGQTNSVRVPTGYETSKISATRSTARTVSSATTLPLSFLLERPGAARSCSSSRTLPVFGGQSRQLRPFGTWAGRRLGLLEAEATTGRRQAERSTGTSLTPGRDRSTPSQGFGPERRTRWLERSRADPACLAPLALSCFSFASASCPGSWRRRPAFRRRLSPSRRAMQPDASL
jgi:hypothetical protein